MSNENKVSIIKQLEAARPAQIVDLPEVADRFKKLYLTFNGKDGGRHYEAEKFHFAKTLQEKPALQQCTKLSLYGCFLDMAVHGLSFDPSMKHAYLVPYNHKVKGPNGVETWEKRAQLQISGQGELLMRANSGQIKYADNPILVYDGDMFRFGTRNEKVFVEHEAAFPRQTDNIIACYIKIVRNDDSVDYKVISMEEVAKLRKFSKDPNSTAWTDGLPGMVQAKCIKHAFRSYPKMRSLARAQFSALASETIDQEEDGAAPGDIYGIEDPAGNDLPASQPTVIIPSKEPGSKPAKQPVIVDDDSFAHSSDPQMNGRVFDGDDF